MSGAAIGLITAVTSVLGTVAVTIWRGRGSGPETQATLVGASDLLMGRMLTRIERLESRVERLEQENDAYHRLYGPLPAGAVPPPTSKET